MYRVASIVGKLMDSDFTSASTLVTLTSSWISLHSYTFY